MGMWAAYLARVGAGKRTESLGEAANFCLNEWIVLIDMVHHQRELLSHTSCEWLSHIRLFNDTLSGITISAISRVVVETHQGNDQS